MPFTVLLSLGSWLVAFLVASLPLIIVWRRAIQWRSTEIALIPIPFLFWELLDYPGVSWHPGKTLENLILENAILGVVPVAYLLYRRYVYPGIPAKRHFYTAAIAGLALAFLLHRFMPTLGMIYD